MPLAGTRAGDRRAGHGGAPGYVEPRPWSRDRQEDPVTSVQAPGARDAGRSAPRRRGEPAPDASARTISSQSRHSTRTVRTQRSAWAFALGACTGVKTTSAPSERNTSSKLRQNFASRSRIRKQTRRPRSPSISSRLRACWVTQAPSGLAVTPPGWIRLVSSSIKNSTYSRRSQTVSTVKQVAGLAAP